MDRFEILEMSIKEEKLFNSLTILQQEFSIGIINGLNKRQAYFKAGGKAKSELSIRRSMSSLVTNCNVSTFIEIMKGKLTEIRLCTSIDVADALMKEAGISKNKLGENEPAPKDANQAGRVSALKTLSGYTGGFDKNVSKKQVKEVTEYKDRPLSELYDDDDDEEDNKD